MCHQPFVGVSLINPVMEELTRCQFHHFIPLNVSLTVDVYRKDKPSRHVVDLYGFGHVYSPFNPTTFSSKPFHQPRRLTSHPPIRLRCRSGELPRSACRTCQTT